MTGFQTVLLLRHELLLIIAAVSIIIYDLLLPAGKKTKIIHFSLILFSVVFLLSFFPVKSGELFGGSFQENKLTGL